MKKKYSFKIFMYTDLYVKFVYYTHSQFFCEEININIFIVGNSATWLCTVNIDRKYLRLHSHLCCCSVIFSSLQLRQQPSQYWACDNVSLRRSL